MTKRKDQFFPRPETVWSSEGVLKGVESLEYVREHTQNLLKRQEILQVREFSLPSKEDGTCGWAFDATWRLADGAEVKARLTFLCRDLFSELAQLLRIRDVSGARSIQWLLVAEADRPWRSHWPSPMNAFFDTSKWHIARSVNEGATGLLSLTHMTTVEDTTESIEQPLLEMAKHPSYITVLTHDRRAAEEVEANPMPPLVHILPPSLLGRVVELRLTGEQDQDVYEALSSCQVSLPWGGAVIVPNRPRVDGWPLSECSISRPAGGDMETMLKEAAVTVERYARLPVHYSRTVRDAVKDMHDTWVLPEIPVSPLRVLEEKRQVEEEAAYLRGVLDELRQDLAGEQQRCRELTEANGTLEKRLHEAEANPVAVEAEQARRQAEDAWIAQEAAVAEAERLAAEVAWLRRERAQMPGKSYADPAPEPPEGPKSWTELLKLARGLLQHVVIMDSVDESLAKIARVTEYGERWRRRTWEALEALEAYAQAKAEHGPDVVPHFDAYLSWPQATMLVPRSMYVSTEARLEHSGKDLRVKRTRMFHVAGLGEVFMGAHMRIGSGRPPAPRMHFYDDTCGPTGKIHIGYLGPHLPNWTGR